MATLDPHSLSPTRNGKRSFAELTEAERWLWYADAYAFEIVYRNANPLDMTTPCDPDRKWYDAQLVNEAVAHKRRFGPKGRTTYVSPAVKPEQGYEERYYQR